MRAVQASQYQVVFVNEYTSLPSTGHTCMVGERGDTLKHIIINVFTDTCHPIDITVSVLLHGCGRTKNSIIYYVSNDDE